MVGVATNITSLKGSESYRLGWERLAALVGQYTIDGALDVIAPESLVNVPGYRLAEAASHIAAATKALNHALVAVDKDPI